MIMEQEDILYVSLITIFLGFIIFLFTIINKQISAISIFDMYFVLFLFFGALIVIVGMIVLLVWHVRHRQPYQEEIKKNTFPSFLGIGAVLIVIGYIFLFHYSNLSNILYIMSLAVSITGILMLLVGLRFYIKEVIIGRTRLHS